jgi:hypothetical protein
MGRSYTLHEKVGDGWRPVRMINSDLQQKVEDILTTPHRGLHLGMIDSIAALAAHPEDRALIKRTPELREILIGKDGKEGPMLFVLKKVAEEYERRGPSAAELEAYKKADRTARELIVGLTTSEIDLAIEGNKLVVKQDGAVLGSMKVDPAALNLDTATLRINGKTVRPAMEAGQQAGWTGPRLFRSEGGERGV